MSKIIRCTQDDLDSHDPASFLKTLVDPEDDGKTPLFVVLPQGARLKAGFLTELAELVFARTGIWEPPRLYVISTWDTVSADEFRDTFVDLVEEANSKYLNAAYDLIKAAYPLVDWSKNSEAFRIEASHADAEIRVAPSSDVAWRVTVSVEGFEAARQNLSIDQLPLALGSLRAAMNASFEVLEQ